MDFLRTQTESMSSEERRRAQRFPLDLPLEVKWHVVEGELNQPTITRDISASGLYFQLNHEMEPNSKVEFFVRLHMEGAPAGGVMLHCVGSVVRVEPTEADPHRVGVAARIDRYRFLRPDEAGSDSLREELKQ